MSAVSIACVGAVYWGKNLVRVFNDLPSTQLKKICDASPEILARIGQQYPDIATTSDYLSLLEDGDIAAVVLAVPATRHYEMARAALEKGKHVYVEKPLTLETEHARDLCALASERGLVLMF